VSGRAGQHTAAETTPTLSPTNPQNDSSGRALKTEDYGPLFRGAR
jgi:hypothetical protein